MRMPLGVAAAAPQVIVRVFTLKYRRAEEALLLVRPFLTESGSLILEAKDNTLTIRDSVAAVEKTAHAIASYDVPPRPVEIAVTLLRATAEKPKGEKRDVPEEVRAIGERLKKLFNYADYTRLDGVLVQGNEGERVVYVVGANYRLEFLLEPSGDDHFVRLKNLSLERLRRDGSGHEVRRDILKTSINVTIGQPYILAVAKDESASGAIFLVFDASWRVHRPGPGIF